MASEKVKDENPASEASDESPGNAKPSGKAKSAGKSKSPGKAKPPGKAKSPGKAEAPSRARKAAAKSGTAAAAAHARTVMQHRHLRISLAMTAAIGVELAGAAGVVAGGLLPWEWGEPLLGRTDQPAIITQVLLGLTLLTLLLAWFLRPHQRAARVRLGTVVLALAGAAFAAALTWRAEFGGRGAGGLVATVAAMLVVAGAVGWLVSLRRLRVLFPFGLADARRTGYGNLTAVRRAQLVGGPVGAVGGAAVVAGALLVFPAWLATEDSQPASPLELGAEPPAAGGAPAWEVELPATAREDRSFAVAATPGGLVIDELQGVRGADPRTGELRWYWRDEAYQRAATALTDGGQTVVLGLRYDGDGDGRDRVVALDTATGEVRWDRYGGDLVAAMSTIVVAPDEGDWFVVPEQEEAAPDATARPPVSLLAVGSDDGQTRWRAAENEGCQFSAVDADSPGMVVTTQECTQDDGTSDCLVTGLDPATGEEVWSWPPEGAASGCRTKARPGLVFVSHDAGEPGEDGSPPPPAAVALDPGTGEQVWAAEPDEDGAIRGLTNPTVMGDAVLGAEFVDDGQGGGHAVVVIREASDGSIRTEVDLPDGRAIDIVPVRDDLAAIPLYRPDTGDVSLLEFDLAGEVRSESPVGTGSPDATVQWLAVAVGPEALTMDTLVAGGGNPEAPDYTLRVAGW